MSVTELGITTCCKDLHCENAQLSIQVTEFGKLT